MDEIISDAIDYIKELYCEDSSGHDYYHTLRVFKIATKLASEENADIAIVQIAALLHDTDDYKLSPKTYKNKDNARYFLEAHDYSEEEINRICLIIDEVSWKGEDSIKPESIEGKCVQDADRLDAIGAVGIARTFAFGGKSGRPIYDPDNKPILNMSEDEYRKRTGTSTSINHFYEKLLLLKESMNTDTAKKMAQHRHEFMENFLDEFLDEWNGIK